MPKTPSITLEDIKQLLTTHNIEFSMVNADKCGFSRKVKFTLNGVNYFIEWWANVSYLSIGGPYANALPFTHLSKDTFYPRYKTGLKFSDGDACFYLAIELLDWQKKESTQ